MYKKTRYDIYVHVYYIRYKDYSMDDIIKV